MLEDKTVEQLQTALLEVQGAQILESQQYEHVDTVLKSPTSRQVFALSAKTSTLVMDMWLESASASDVKTALAASLTMLTRALEKASKPGPREAIVAGMDDFGQVFMPTDLFRALWQLGESADALLERKGGGEAVEEKAREVLNLAVDWVRFCKGKDERKPYMEEVTVTPMEGQRLLHGMNSRPKPEGGPAPF